MGLDARGYVSVVELVVYVPLAFATGFLVFNTGHGRKAGWVYLMVLSIVRVIGGALHIATETDANPPIALFIATGVLESAGLSPLMLATLGFLKVVAQESLDKQRFVNVAPILLHMLNAAALALSTTGGVKVGTAKSQDDLNSGTTFRHIGGVLFLVQFSLIALLHIYFWTEKKRILKYRRMLLAGISFALPFLFLRVLYSFLSGLAPVGLPGGPPPERNSLSPFNSTTGQWQIYFLMSVLTEIMVVSIYLFVGLRFPVHKDYAMGKMEQGFDSDIELSKEGPDGRPLL